jgi:hypothetical protein
MTATKKNEPARDAKGVLLCTECEDGKVECQGYEPWKTYLEDCQECDGRGTLVCPQCGEPAKVMGAEQGIAYCSIEHAWADENWSACVGCGEHPQITTYAPWCSAACEDEFRRRVERSALADRVAS